MTWIEIKEQLSEFTKSHGGELRQYEQNSVKRLPRFKAGDLTTEQIQEALERLQVYKTLENIRYEVWHEGKTVGALIHNTEIQVGYELISDPFFTFNIKRDTTGGIRQISLKQEVTGLAICVVAHPQTAEPRLRVMDLNFISSKYYRYTAEKLENPFPPADVAAFYITAGIPFPLFSYSLDDLLIPANKGETLVSGNDFPISSRNYLLFGLSSSTMFRTAQEAFPSQVRARSYYALAKLPRALIDTGRLSGEEFQIWKTQGYR